jgi:hypothetical protein
MIRRRLPAELREPAGDLSQPAAFPAPVVWSAAVVIVLLAGVGAYRGAVSARTGAPGSSLISPDSLVSAPPVSAEPAAPLAHDPNWSTLSGPQVLPPPAPKPAAKPETDEAGSGAPDDQSAAAEAAPSAPQSEPSAPAAPPGVQAVPPPAPAPADQGDAQPQ